MYAPQGLEKMSQEDIFITQDVIPLNGGCCGISIAPCRQHKTIEMFNSARSGEEKGQLIYKAEEKSHCTKNCLPAQCRPFQMSIMEKDYINNRGDESAILELNRECTCTFLCLERPELIVQNVINGGEVHIGKIKDPWKCMDLQVDVHDETDTLKFKISGSGCQPGLFQGLFCNWSCETCQSIDFDIYDAAGENIGALQKSTKTGNFTTFFPTGVTSNDRALLLAASIMLDLTYFLQSPGAEKGPCCELLECLSACA